MPLSCGHGTKRKSFGALSAPRPHRTHVVPNKKPVILSLTSIINIKMSTTWLRPWMTWRQDEILKKKLQSFQSRQDWMITLTPTLIGLSTVAVVRLCEGRVPKRFHPMSSHHGCVGTHSSALRSPIWPQKKIQETFHFCLRPFYEQHTAANIIEKVTRIMDEFGKVTFVCTDNDHNIKKALFEQHRGADYWCWACSWGGGRKFPGTHIGTLFSQDVWI